VVTTRRCGALGLLLLLCLGASGCGRTADREQATQVAERFFTALGSGDGAAACAQLSADTRTALEDDEQQPCREAIGGLSIDAGSPAKLELYLTNAKADLDNGQSAFLSQTAEGGSRRPVAGRATARPPTCRWTASWRPEMRVLPVLYVLVIVAVLAFYISVGLIAR
jgi:hypothetical protein